MSKVLFLLIVINALAFSLRAQGRESFLSLPVMGIVNSDTCEVYSARNLAQRVGGLKKGDTVIIIKWAPHCVFVQSPTKQMSGYSNYTQFDLPEDVEIAISNATVKLEEALKKQNDKEAFDKMQKSNLASQRDLIQKGEYYEKLFGKDVSRQIIAHKYWIGMTKSMAKYSLGKPKTVNKTRVGSVAKEDWIYADGPTLFFKEDVLENFKDN